jgi:hypothetical protein
MLHYNNAKEIWKIILKSFVVYAKAWSGLGIRGQSRPLEFAGRDAATIRAKICLIEHQA